MKEQYIIYAIKNIVKDIFYIGSTSDYNERLKENLLRLNKGNHHNPDLQKDWLAQRGKGFICGIVSFSTFSKRFIDEFMEMEGRKCYNIHKMPTKKTIQLQKYLSGYD